jgi:putative nucleotidyltransferase with HDIG domain
MKKIFPELLWISDEVLREKVRETFMDGLAQGGWTLEDMDQYTFSLNCPDHNVSFRDHIRSITRMAHAVYQEYSERYAGKYTLNYNHIIAGSLLHDVGKFIELTKDEKSTSCPKAVVYSAEAKYLNHAFLGAALAFKHGLPIEVSHIIAYHSKEGELNKKSPEAIVMTYADLINFHPLRAQAAFAD